MSEAEAWRALIAQAEEALDRSDTDDAADFAEDVLELDGLPDEGFVAALVVRGKVALVEGQLPDALEDFDALLQMAPAHPPGLLYRGFVHASMGMFPEAQADWEAAAATDAEGPIGEAARAQIKLLATRGEDEVGGDAAAFDTGWGAVALPSGWEQRPEQLDPPGHHWSTAASAQHLLVWAAEPTGETTLEELFEEVVGQTTATVQKILGSEAVEEQRESFGPWPAHTVRGGSTSPQVCVATVALQAPNVVLSARLLDHSEDATPDATLAMLVSLLNGASIKA